MAPPTLTAAGRRALRCGNNKARIFHAHSARLYDAIGQRDVRFSQALCLRAQSNGRCCWIEPSPGSELNTTRERTLSPRRRSQRRTSATDVRSWNRRHRSLFPRQAAGGRVASRTTGALGVRAFGTSPCSSIWNGWCSVGTTDARPFTHNAFELGRWVFLALIWNRRSTSVRHSDQPQRLRAVSGDASSRKPHRSRS